MGGGNDNVLNNDGSGRGKSIREDCVWLDVGYWRWTLPIFILSFCIAGRESHTLDIIDN